MAKTVRISLLVLLAAAYFIFEVWLFEWSKFSLSESVPLDIGATALAFGVAVGIEAATGGAIRPK